MALSCLPIQLMGGAFRKLLVFDTITVFSIFLTQIISFTIIISFNHVVCWVFTWLRHSICYAFNELHSWPLIWWNFCTYNLSHYSGLNSQISFSIKSGKLMIVVWGAINQLPPQVKSLPSFLCMLVTGNFSWSTADYGMQSVWRKEKPDGGYFLVTKFQDLKRNKQFGIFELQHPSRWVKKVATKFMLSSPIFLPWIASERLSPSSLITAANLSTLKDLIKWDQITGIHISWNYNRICLLLFGLH